MTPPPTDTDVADEVDVVDDADRAEVVEPTVPDTKVRRDRSPAKLLALVTGLAVVLGLVASVMTAGYVRVRADRDSARDDRTTVATTAARAAEAMTAIDAN